MNKLTIQHIAPYLPYELNGCYRLGDVIKNTHNPDEIRDKLLRDDNVDFFLQYCKPILRPMNILTKELNDDLSYFDDKWFHICFKDGRYIHVEGETVDYSLFNYEKLPYYVMQFFFEHHFDIFDLVRKGLAVYSYDDMMKTRR